MVAQPLIDKGKQQCHILQLKFLHILEENYKDSSQAIKLILPFVLEETVKIK